MLADDHNIFRQMTASSLNRRKNMVVIGHAPDGQELLNLVEKNIPDIILLDLEMPVLDGFDTLKKIVERFPAVRTIMLSSHYDEFYIGQLLIIGASS